MSFVFRGGATFAGAGGEVRYATVDGDTLVFADIDGDRRADLEFTLDGVVALTAGDFIL